VLELAGAETASGGGELEGPEEVGSLLEVGSNSEDLVDQVLNGDDTELAEVLLNDGVVGQGDTLAVDLSVTALVDQLTDGLQVGLSVSDPGLNNAKHLRSSLRQLDEDTVVDLEETEKLEDLAGLGGDLVDTIGNVSGNPMGRGTVLCSSPLDANNEDNLGLSRDEEGALLLGLTGKADLLTLSLAVLLDVLLGALEDSITLLLVGLCIGVSGNDSPQNRNSIQMNTSNLCQTRKMVNERQHRLLD
jgi:hypothetical protein